MLCWFQQAGRFRRHRLLRSLGRTEELRFSARIPSPDGRQAAGQHAAGLMPACRSLVHVQPKHTLQGLLGPRPQRLYAPIDGQQHLARVIHLACAWAHGAGRQAYAQSPAGRLQQQEATLSDEQGSSRPPCPASFCPGSP